MALAARKLARPLWLWGALCVLLAACAPQQGLVLLKQPPSLDWRDDGSSLRLSRAIEESIAYYRKLPPDTEFHYGVLVYSPAELIASLQLFRDTYLSAPDAETLAREIDKRFHVFESLRGEGGNLFTGYYEPELEASATPTDRLNTPIYALPDDLVQVHLARFSDSLPPTTLMGRVVGGQLVPYYTRAEIQGDDALSQRAKPIAYVDPVELFFLQVQGSGLLRFPDGHQVQVGYAGSNGQPYRSIGALLVQNDAMPLAQVSMQSIRAWLHAHPEQQREVLFSNPSYVFFQVRSQGPLGNLKVPLTAGRSLAADQRVIPAGSLAYIVTQVPVAGSTSATRTVQRFMLVQDTGGAIRGDGRADLFWGAGQDAAWTAGHQRSTGRLMLLVARKAYLPKPLPAQPVATSAATAASSSPAAPKPSPAATAAVPVPVPPAAPSPTTPKPRPTITAASEPSQAGTTPGAKPPAAAPVPAQPAAPPAAPSPAAPKPSPAAKAAVPVPAQPTVPPAAPPPAGAAAGLAPSAPAVRN